MPHLHQGGRKEAGRSAPPVEQQQQQPQQQQEEQQQGGGQAEVVEAVARAAQVPCASNSKRQCPVLAG